MSERQWYYIRNGQQYGPVPEARLVELFGERTLGPETQVWTQQLQNWCKASEVQHYIALTAPLLPTTLQGAAQSVTSARPAVVTVFGIINTVFGSLGLVSIPFTIITIFARSDLINRTETMKMWLLFSSAIRLAFTILLLATGIGLLKLKAWAPVWSLRYGWFAIVWCIVGMIVSVVFLKSGAYGYPGNAARYVIIGIFGGAISLVYPILLVVFMRRPNVRNACTR